MPNAYSRLAKINNPIGRHDYISNPARQEEIILHKECMKYDWDTHIAYEQAHQRTDLPNNIALEVHLALPNELSNNLKSLETVCDTLVANIIGPNFDHEYAVHWNKKRNNLHVHILFSERENQLDLIPKIYKKDIWHDEATHKLAKAHAEGAILVHKKGDIQKDKNGNIIYETDIFKSKDRKFNSAKFLNLKNQIVSNTLKSYGFNVNYQYYNSPYLSQRKWIKGNSPFLLEYKRNIIEYNKLIKEYNTLVNDILEIEPTPARYEEFVKFKREVISHIYQINNNSKKFDPTSTSLLSDLINYLENFIDEMKVDLTDKQIKKER